MGSTWCDIDAWVRVCSRNLRVFAVKRENESAVSGQHCHWRRETVSIPLGHCEVLFLVPVPVVRRNKLLALGFGDGGGIRVRLNLHDAVAGFGRLPFCRPGAITADQMVRLCCLCSDERHDFDMTGNIVRSDNSSVGLVCESEVKRRGRIFLRTSKAIGKSSTVCS